MRIGIIGAGWWAAHAYIPRLQNNPAVTEISVCRPDREGLEILRSQLGVEHLFEDAGALLDQHKPGGVIVSSPHTLHGVHARMCIQRGIPVLIEKPMTTAVGEAREIASATQEHQSFVMVAYGWNFSPVATRARALLDEIGIGSLEHAVCITASATYELFSGKPPASTAAHLFQPPGSTWSDPGQAGGYAWGQLTHALGLFFLLVDQSPTSVIARMQLSNTGVDMSDSAIIELAGGAFVSVSGTGRYPKGPRKLLEIRLHGSEGTMTVDMETDRLELVRFDGRSVTESFNDGAGEYGVERLLSEFVRACAGQSVVNHADVTVGLRAVEAIEAMYRSAKSGQVAKI